MNNLIYAHYGHSFSSLKDGVVELRAEKLSFNPDFPEDKKVQ